VLIQVPGACQLVLGAVFLVAALPKLRRPRAFRDSVVAYEILPTSVATAVSAILIPLELILGIAFPTGLLLAIALPLATGLIGVFLVAVGVNLRRGRRIACGCFGNGREPISSRTLLRLLLLLGIVLLLIAYPAGQSPMPSLNSLARDEASRSFLIQRAWLAAVLALLAAWLLNLPEFLLVFRRMVPSGPSPAEAIERDVEGS
jgi:putative oxidoreductase